jgi:K+-transporting ATPase ATPase B chain
VIFNALIIVALIPLALRGVRYRAIGKPSRAVSRRNALIYGLGVIDRAGSSDISWSTCS